MTSTDIPPLSPPGTSEYAQAGASFQNRIARVRSDVDPTGPFAGDVALTRDQV